jgi:hypothetical protein
MAPATVSAGWSREMRSAIVAKVRNRNPMEVADDLGHSWRFRMAGSYRAVARIDVPSTATSMSSALDFNVQSP